NWIWQEVVTGLIPHCAGIVGVHRPIFCQQGSVPQFGLAYDDPVNILSQARGGPWHVWNGSEMRAYDRTHNVRTRRSCETASFRAGVGKPGQVLLAPA
ncbi:MAG: hypothetical protein V3S30_03340, partial [Thermoanaerobaculia bacterium]